MTITEFLLARIAEDEALAREAIDPERPGTHWQWARQDDRVVDLPTWEDMPVYLGTVEEYPTGMVGDLPAFALNSVEADEPRALPHIARHDPARVLAECEAKRRIVEFTLAEGYADDGMVTALRALAAVYADHPDFRERWRA